MTQPIALGFTEGLTALEELHQRDRAGHHDYAIMLAGGLAISRKTIWFLAGRWEITNQIDGSHQSLLDPDLWSQSNIGEALDKRALLDMNGDYGLLNVEGRGWVNGNRWLAEIRSGGSEASGALPDEAITDWFAGARLTGTKKKVIDAVGGWESGDAVVAFSDIGVRDTDEGPDPRGQVVVYVTDHVNGRTYACSAEIDTSDALKIAKHLTRWAKKARKENKA